MCRAKKFFMNINKLSNNGANWALITMQFRMNKYAICKTSKSYRLILQYSGMLG